MNDAMRTASRIVDAAWEAVTESAEYKREARVSKQSQAAHNLVGKLYERRNALEAQMERLRVLADKNAADLEAADRKATDLGKASFAAHQTRVKSAVYHTYDVARVAYCEARDGRKYETAAD